MRDRIGVLMAMALATSACDSAKKPAADSARTAAKSSVAAANTSAAPAPTASSAAASPTLVAASPAPTASAEEVATAAPPLSAGQWARYELTEGVSKSTQEFRVIRVDADGTVVFEVEGVGSGQKSVTEFVVDMKDRKTLEGIVVKQARVKTNTGIVTVPESGVKAQLIHTVKGLRMLDVTAARKQDITVAAGTFTGCAVTDFEDKKYEEKIKATSYAHPSVPISGLVKYEGTIGDRPLKNELVAFGLTGAKSSF